MSNPDSKLKLLEEMALLAKSSPANSKERQKWLTKLTNEIQNSNKVYCKNIYNFPKSVYQDIFHEALQQTFLEKGEDAGRWVKGEKKNAKERY